MLQFNACFFAGGEPSFVLLSLSNRSRTPGSILSTTSIATISCNSVIVSLRGLPANIGLRRSSNTRPCRISSSSILVSRGHDDDDDDDITCYMDCLDFFIKNCSKNGKSGQQVLILPCCLDFSRRKKSCFLRFFSISVRNFLFYS